MKRKSLWIGAVAGLMLAAASAVALAGIGDDPVKNLEIIGLPRGGSCTCPANWEPVVCRASDGSLQAFSNACVAGCYGYTSCARIVVSPAP